MKEHFPGLLDRCLYRLVTVPVLPSCALHALNSLHLLIIPPVLFLVRESLNAGGMETHTTVSSRRIKMMTVGTSDGSSRGAVCSVAD